MTEKSPEPVLADLALADVPVPVHAGAEIFETIVQVDAPEPFETDG